MTSSVFPNVPHAPPKWRLKVKNQYEKIGLITTTVSFFDSFPVVSTITHHHCMYLFLCLIFFSGILVVIGLGIALGVAVGFSLLMIVLRCI